MLQQLGEDAEVLAGGQSLIPLLNLRLARPAHLLRVVSNDVGGAFGLKGFVYREDVAVAAASKSLGRPVTWLPPTRILELTGAI